MGGKRYELILALMQMMQPNNAMPRAARKGPEKAELDHE
jgi:hypothetical protein